MHRLPTASALDRATACPGSMALPQHPHASADTEWGVAVHRFLDRAHEAGREVALGEIDDPDYQARCAAIDLAAIPPGASSEVALAYDPDTDRAEILRLDGPRRYPDDGRIYGTFDRIGVRDGRLWLGDFKSGAMKVRARDAMQLRLGALAGCRAAGLDEAHVEMLYLGHDGKWYVDRADFDAMDLDATRGELLEMRARVREAHRVVEAGGLPQLLPGLHCDHCAAASECPAQRRQQDALVARAPTDLVTWIADMPPEQAGQIVEQAIVVAKLAEGVREAARERVLASGDLALPSGRVLKKVRHSSEKQDPEAKEKIAALKNRLREERHITTEAGWQVRVVGGARRPVAVLPDCDEWAPCLPPPDAEGTRREDDHE